MSIKAEIVADSINTQGDRLTSILATFPRIILSEINTHRMLSKNTSSSRAIPFNKMVEAIQNNPFIPIAWQKDHKGMQGSEYLLGDEAKIAETNWYRAADYAIMMARDCNKVSITKQLCNRLLEPFMWTTMLITGTDDGWGNFFNLRCPSYEVSTGATDKEYFKSKETLLKKYPNMKPEDEMDWFYINKGQAEIHMMDIAEKIYNAFTESTPKQLQSGEWHIPFENKIDIDKVEDLLRGTHRASYIRHDGDIEQAKVEISTAMTARVSYTVVGDEKEVSYRTLISIHDKMVAANPFHASPFEHCAKAMTSEEYYQYFKGSLSTVEILDDSHLVESYLDDNLGSGWCRNYKGFIMYRHLLES